MVKIQVKLCLIDDEIDIVTTMLSELMINHYVCGFTSTQEALDAFGKGLKVDLIITDLRVPGLNGIEFIRRLRKMNIETPIIIVSGYIDKKIMSQGRSVGVSIFLEKPFGVRELSAAIQQALKNPSIDTTAA